MNFPDLMKETELEFQKELLGLKCQWEGIKLIIAKEKIETPELAQQLDDYMNLIKNETISYIRNFSENYDEEEKEDIEKTFKYVFGEDYV